MKYIKIILLSSILISCQALYQTPKEYYEIRNRTYSASYDSIFKELVEFIAYSQIPSKVTSVAPGLVVIEEYFTDEQINKYTSYVPSGNNSITNNCHEKLIINIKSNSSKTIVDIKSMIMCNVSYFRPMGKFSGGESTTKDIECNSTGMREKEILDYLGK